jgi:hypothetical protein
MFIANCDFYNSVVILTVVFGINMYSCRFDICILVMNILFPFSLSATYFLSPQFQNVGSFSFVISQTSQTLTSL